MPVPVALLLVALWCGVHGGPPDPLLEKVQGSKHMALVYGWSEVDYAYPDTETRDQAINEEAFIPGNSVPISVDVDSASGRVFVSMPRFKPGNPATLATVSKLKSTQGEHLLEPYPDWSWHKQGDCDGITSVFRVFVDECRRLWVLDTGTKGSPTDYNRICPAKIVIFDLTNNQLIKKYPFPVDQIMAHSVLTTIVVDVRDTARKCKETFAYVSDVTGYSLLVYNLAKDESWRVTANEMYPYPPFGFFDIKGSRFDLMDGILGLALTPKKSNVERYLYFHSLASNVESWVATSLLRNKTNFADGANLVARQFYTSLGKRLGGQAAAEAFDENGVLWFSVLSRLTVNCWNSNKEYTEANIVQVDRDTEAFQFISGVKVVKPKQGPSELWILSSRFQKQMVGDVDSNEVNYRIMKAPIEKLAKGTSCDGSIKGVGSRPQTTSPNKPSG